MTAVDYTKLTKADLVRILEDKHGITYGDISKVSKAELIDKVNDMEGNTVPVPLGEQAVNENDPRKSGDKRRLKSVVINIHVGESRENQQDVFVGVNGRGYQIQRGKNVTVSPSVYGALKLAVETTYTPERDPQTNKTLLKGVESLRYPFSVVEKIFA